MLYHSQELQKIVNSKINILIQKGNRYSISFLCSKISCNGKNPIIPTEMKKMVSKLVDDMSAAKYKKVSDLESHYSNFECLLEYEPEIKDNER